MKDGLGREMDANDTDLMDFVLVLCERCGSEGRLIYADPTWSDPLNERDGGECPECEGTGRCFVPAEVRTLEDIEEEDESEVHASAAH